jgi:hypothetical protein
MNNGFSGINGYFSVLSDFTAGGYYFMSEHSD